MIYDWLATRDFAQKCVMLLIVLAVLWSPLYTLLLLIPAFLLKDNRKWRTRYLCVLVALLMIFVFLTGTSESIYIFPSTWWDYFFALMPVRMIASIAVTFVCIFFEFGSLEIWMIQQEKEKQKKIYSKTEKLEFKNRNHVFIAGTTGAGKSQLLLRFIRDSLKKCEPLYIISGKASNDATSLLDDVIAMCEAYNRKLYVISMNPQRSESRPYNPFKGCKIVEIADALVNASEFTEPHYKYNLSTWVKIVCEVLQCARIPFSLQSILFFMDYDNFSDLLKQLLKEKILTQKDVDKYASYKDIALIASSSRSRFLNLLLGEGKEILAEENAICAEDVRRDNAVLFVDLDSFAYTDFTSTLGAFFINDIRHLISTETDKGNKRVIMDELANYVTPQIMPLFSQSRSFGYQLVVATQSIADIEQINEKLAERIMENCGQYGILQLNSADDAEKISKTIGTKVAVEATRKTSGIHLHPTADGSMKVINAFKIPPDTIKELEALEVIFYDKKKPEEVKRIKMKYGWKNA